jgi:hypothetical protein
MVKRPSNRPRFAPSPPFTKFMTARPLTQILLRSVLAVSSASAPLGSALAAPPTAPAPEANTRDEARARFQHGVELFRDGDARAALIEFRRAYELSPNYRVLYNIGQASFEAQDYPASLDAFQRYLAEGGKEIPQARRTQVEADLKRLDARLARLVVTSNVPGAEILIDDVSVGRTPLTKPLVVGIGRRKVSVAMAGRETQTRLIDIAGGDNATVDLAFPPVVAIARPLPEAQDAPLPPAEVPHAEPFFGDGEGAHNDQLPWLKIGAVTTGVFAVAAGTTAVLAWRAHRDFDNTLSNDLDAKATLDDERQRTRRWALATDILAGTTVAVGATTFIGWLVTRHTGATGVSVGVVDRGLAVAGRF